MKGGEDRTMGGEDNVHSKTLVASVVQEHASCLAGIASLYSMLDPPSLPPFLPHACPSCSPPEEAHTTVPCLCQHPQHLHLWVLALHAGGGGDNANKDV